MVATVTLGSIIGTIGASVCLLIVLVGAIAVWDGAGLIAAVGLFLVGALVVVGVWWWGMAFTLSGDYHAWNAKQGRVEAVSKRLVPAGDKGMQERFVFRLSDGALYGVDDTRASLVKVGDNVSLKCKKDFEWGTPREAHGWACKWNRVPAVG